MLPGVTRRISFRAFRDSGGRCFLTVARVETARSDPVKSFRRGEGEPFFKRGPLSPSHTTKH